jgi:hypothetical protein
MPAPVKGGVVQADAIRVCQLDPAGTPVWGASSCVQSENIVKLDFKPVWQAGASFDTVDGQGRACTSFQGRDTLKRMNYTLQICDMDLQLRALIEGGTLFTGTAGVIEGYQPPKEGVIGNPNGVSVEVWAKRIVGDVQVGWWHFAFTRMFLHWNDSTLGNSIMDMTFDGWGNSNINWGSGPMQDFTHDTSAPWQSMIAAALPTPRADGFITITAPV